MTTKDVSITVSPAMGAPVINSAATASVIEGSAFNYTLAATNSPTSYSATGLPAGLSINSATGIISGTPQIAGTYNVQVSATNASGVGYANLALTVKLPLPTFSNSANADGVVNTAFSYTIAATPDATSYTAVGLPATLTLDTVAGTITGTPTATGTISVTITATNTTGTTSSTLTIVIYASTPAAPAITSSGSATGTMGSAFSYLIAGTNTPTGFFAIGLPAGLFFDQNSGVISGTPAVAGTFNVTIRASNRGGTGATTLALTIQDTPFNTWCASRFTSSELTDPNISGSSADPDHDGLSNLAEFALNRDPKTPDGSAFQFFVQHDSSDGNNYLTVVYTRRIAPSGITYHVEASNDLVNWNEGTGFTQEMQATDDGNGITQTVTTRASTALSQGNRQFLRLRFTTSN